MKSRIAKTLTFAALVASLAACSSVPLDEKGGQGTGTGGMTSTGSGPVMDPFNPSSPLAQQKSVFFDYDSYTVNPQYSDLVKMHSDYVAGHANQRVRLEGNTDPRGSAEYNLALGTRRGNAVADQMKLNGVNASQIEVVSFGKEHATGKDEASWAQDRRVDINYLR
ncbi:peptidoglycan-associated lipoprotein [Bordetella genomosp. 9]|uniref:OmpA family protein n=1 Tax=Bordetella genomosp. 9 TaxID=1416803 RepID=UPI000A28DC88|nr:OmpA family protein [Bordetella genomosp. 9]ARP89553.1 peptidoglycan-associated lipoprotein [Bordetella genomosp. 9]